MKINIINVKEENLKKAVKWAFKAVLENQKQPLDCEMSVKFVSESEIKELNSKTRGIDKVTDVLSYPNLTLQAGEIIDKQKYSQDCIDGKNIYIGDCAICLSVALKQASEFGVSLESEVKKLVVHSVLHLLGYDHILDEDYVVMHKIENEILGERDGEF